MDYSLEVVMSQRKLLVALALAALSVAGCTAGGNIGGGPQPINVTVAPLTANVRAGDTQTFAATVTGTTNTGVAWSVNGIIGGNATLGTISAVGLYTAPATLPTPNSVNVTATSQQDVTKTGTSPVTLLNPIAVITQSWPSFLGVSPNTPVTLIITGSKFVSGAQVLFSGMPFNTTVVSATQITATGTIPATTSGAVQVVVRNPDPGAANSAAATATVSNALAMNETQATRFLEQATFGPSGQSINQVRYVGFQNFLNDQFNAPSSTFDDAVADAMGQFNDPTTLQKRWFTNALFGADQLRQRLAFVLHKIWVVSWVNVDDSRAFVSYLRMHQNHAFGNYRQIMENVSKNPAMGRYQDIANNDGATNRTGSCNENYGRELMQLFTVGLWRLNANGTFQLGGDGLPIAAYDPVAVVEQNACAMTGWTYAKETPATRDWPRPPFYGAPLEAVESHHDPNVKTLIDGFVVPAGGTAQRDLTLTLDNIFCHPNLGPFISKLLIQQFVTSNPSPAYVQRVATVFNGTGACTPGGTMPPSRGDMRTVISAILLDPEARRGDTLPDTDSTVASDGKFKEPVLFVTNLFRALGAQSDGSLLGNNVAGSMGQRLLFPPTVFSYFSPEYRIPGSALFAPELNIQTTATTFARINSLNTIAFGTLSGTSINWTPLANLAANPDAAGQLLDTLNVLMLRGKMSAAYRAQLNNAINAVPAGATQNEQRARTAVYLIASSSQYNVQH